MHKTSQARPHISTDEFNQKVVHFSSIAPDLENFVSTATGYFVAGKVYAIHFVLVPRKILSNLKRCNKRLVNKDRPQGK